MGPLTPKQKAFLSFIKKFLEQKGYAPTLQDMAAHFQLSSLGTVQQYLEALEEKGYIERSSKARGLRLVNVNSIATSVELPVLGKVAAGHPLEYKKNSERREVPRWMIKKQGEHFLLQVQGDSMIGEGIMDGDFVIVHRQTSADPGEIVVATLDEEATIKKFIVKKNRIELHSANPQYAPILVAKESSFRVEGVYCGLLRLSL